MSARPMLRRIAGVAAILVLGGCATLEYGAEDTVAVVTDPPGASIVASTGTTCLSPCKVVGPRKDGFSITIVKPGFVTQTVGSQSTPTADAAEATRNEISADYLGRVIDAQNGSHNEHAPAAIVVKLDPVM